MTDHKSVREMREVVHIYNNITYHSREEEEKEEGCLVLSPGQNYYHRFVIVTLC